MQHKLEPKQLLGTEEINALMTIVGKARRGKVSNAEIREMYQIQNITKLTRKRMGKPYFSG